jgi:hypothetical protein
LATIVYSNRFYAPLNFAPSVKAQEKEKAEKFYSAFFFILILN